MNILEHYILEHEVIGKVTYEFTNQEYLKVKLKTNCYGVIEDRIEIVTEKEYREAVRKGYFLW